MTVPSAPGAPVAPEAIGADILDALRDIVGPANLLTAPAETEPYCVSWGRLWRGAAAAVALPGSTEELAAVVHICAAARVPMVPQGGNTALTGSSTPRPQRGELVVSLRRLRRIRDVDPVNDTITVDAGVILADAQDAAERVNRMLPISLAAEGSCQIGGLVSTNAGGTQVLRYGNMRQLVLGLKVVLPDGRILPALRGLRKDSAGYDLKQLFIGAEGTLGFATAAVLRLVAQPVEREAAFVSLGDIQAACALLGFLRERLGEHISAFELIRDIGVEITLAAAPALRAPLPPGAPWYALVELSGQTPGALLPALEDALATALDKAFIIDAAIAKNEEERHGFWRLRERISEAQGHAGPGVKHDISVPISQLAVFVDTADARLDAIYPGIRLLAFGHLGDGNLHYNPIMPAGWSKDDTERARPEVNRIVHDAVMACGGSITAEHGIGQLRVQELPRYRSPVEIAVMRQLKAAIDPLGLMNPGKVLDDGA